MSLQVQVNDVGAQLKEQHEYVKAEISKISEEISEEVVDAAFPSWRLKLLWQLRDFANNLYKHFDLEEEGGFMREVLDIAPQHQHAVKKLEAEHVTLATSLNQTVAEFKALSLPNHEKLGAIRSQLDKWFHSLRNHESVENELIMNTYLRDEGGND